MYGAIQQTNAHENEEPTSISDSDDPPDETAGIDEYELLARHLSPIGPGSFVCQDEAAPCSMSEEGMGLQLRMQPQPHEATPIPVQAGTWQDFVPKTVAQEIVPPVR